MESGERNEWKLGAPQPPSPKNKHSLLTRTKVESVMQNRKIRARKICRLMMALCNQEGTCKVSGDGLGWAGTGAERQTR
jgi:hypothetical protein